MTDTYGHKEAMIELHDLGILAPKWRPAYKRLAAYITTAYGLDADQQAEAEREMRDERGDAWEDAT